MTNTRSFAIGDIHGCNTTFQVLLQRLALQAGDALYCLGDYIDRGPDSKGVIDTILAVRKGGVAVHTLRGNHEQLLLEAWEDREAVPLWLRNGGDAALKSFGIKRVADLPTSYLDFFHQTEDYIIAGNAILVHAGLNFSLDDPFEDHYAMLWTREPFVDAQWIGDRIVAHGHTPTPLEDIRQQKGPVYNIDGGCVYKKSGYGNLVAMNLDTRELIVQPSVEK